MMTDDQESRNVSERAPTSRKRKLALIGGVVVAGVLTTGLIGTRATAGKATLVPPAIIEATHGCIEVALGRKIADDDHMSVEEVPSVVACMRSNGQAEDADLLEKSLSSSPDVPPSDKSGGPTAKCVRRKDFAVSDGFNFVISAADVPAGKRAAFADAWVSCGQLSGSEAENVRNLIMRADPAAANEQRALNAADTPKK
jgi:hypothetical protein